MEFRKIKKEILTEEVIEGEVEKEETSSDVMNSYEAQEEAKTAAVEYRNAILNAAESESNAIEEYEGILKMEEQTDKEIVDLFHETIVHIKDEEKAHFQMLTEALSKFPGFDVEKELEDAKSKEEKESVKESVNSARTYSVWDVEDALWKMAPEPIPEGISDPLDLVRNAPEYSNNTDEFSAEQAQKIINDAAALYSWTEAQVATVEEILNKTTSPAEERISEFKDDITSDIYQLQNLVDEEKITTEAAKEKIKQVIEYLNNLEYNGNINTVWKKEQFDKDYAKNLIK